MKRFEEDSMESEIAKALPVWRHERWFDICFRLTLLALVGLWLLTPPAETEHRPAQTKAAATIR